MNDTKKEFEANFPVPIGVKFHPEGDYVWFGGMNHGSNCETYNSLWKAWQACQNLNNERIANLEKTHKAEIALLNDAINEDKILVAYVKELEADAKCMQWIEQNCKDYGTHIEIRIADLKGILRDAIIEQLKT